MQDRKEVEADLSRFADALRRVLALPVEVGLGEVMGFAKGSTHPTSYKYRANDRWPRSLRVSWQLYYKYRELSWHLGF
jgi:hypothetical protein